MPPAGPQTANPLATFFPIIMMFLIFYIIVFRPQAKARKEHEKMLKELKKHDEVVTSGVFKLRNGAAVRVNNTVQPTNNPAPEPEDS